MKLTSKDWICITLLVAVPVVAWLAVFRPRNENMQQARQRIVERRAGLQQMDYAQVERERLKEEMDRCQLGLDYFLARLPDDKYVDQVVRDIWQIAEMNNIKTTNIRLLNQSLGPVMDSGQQQFSRQPLSVSVRGDFKKDFFGFLAQIERASRITRIHDLDISRASDGPEGTIDATMLLSVFYQK